MSTPISTIDFKNEIKTLTILLLRAFYSRKMKALSASAVNTSEKVNLYKSTFIKFMAVAEVIGISGVTGFLLTGQYLFFVVAGMALVQMLQKCLLNQNSIL
jgi:hypothetical protein